MRTYIGKSGRISALVAIIAVMAFAVPFVAFELNAGYGSAEGYDDQTDLSYTESIVSDVEKNLAAGAKPKAPRTADYTLTITFVGNGTVNIINGDDGTTLIASVTGTNGEERTVIIPFSVGSINIGAVNAPPYFFKHFIVDDKAPSITNPKPTGINDDMTVTAEFSTAVPYIDADGSTKTYNTCKEINASNGAISLATGWYYVTEDATLSGNRTINGDVRLIIANGVTLKVNGAGGIQVQGGSLSVFSQPPTGGSGMGMLSVFTDGINYSGSSAGRNFTNTANIEGSVNSTVALNLTNGVTGIIHRSNLTTSVLASGSVVNNYNMFQGLMGISTAGGNNITINNYAGTAGTTAGALTPQLDYRGVISCSSTAIQLGAGSSINNWGTIVGNNIGITSNGASGGITVTNNPGGVIQGTSYAIQIASTGSASTITNNGRIVGSNCSIIASNVVNVFNGSYVSDPVSGVIETITSGSAIYFSGGNSTITNNGRITGIAHGIYATANVTYFNNADGEITGKGGDGISLVGGGNVTNKGTITGTSFGVRAFSAATLVNSGVIKGVSLGNYINSVTFTVGSKITGDFIIGTNAKATLHFKGSDAFPVLGEDLTFSTVTGSFNIGKGTATVTFDPLAVPSDARTLVLIGGGTATADSYPREPTIYNGHLLYIKDNKDLIATKDFFTVTAGSIVGSGSIQWSLDGTNWTSFLAGGNKNFAIVKDEPKTVHLKAVPGTGFEFSLWTGVPYGGSNPYEYTAEKDVTVGAEFVDTARGILDEDYFKVAVGDIVGDGKIMWSLEGTEWFDFPSEGYKVLSIIAGNPKTVYLKAVPGDDFSFSLWKNDIPYGSKNPYEHAGEKSITAGAEFVDTTNGTPGVDYFIVSLGSIVGDGTVMWSLDNTDWFGFPSEGYKVFSAVAGQPRIVHLEAVPGSDSEFSFWSGSIPYGAENPYEHASQESITVGAEFVDTTNGTPDVNYFTVTLGSIVGNGTIMWSFDGNDWFGFPSEGYKVFNIVAGQPKTVYLEAVPGNGLEFSLWMNDIPYGSKNPYVYTAEKSITVGAEFVDTTNGTPDVNYFTVTLGSIVGNGTIMWSFDGTDWFGFPSEGYKVFSIISHEPKTVHLKAVPGTGFEFSLWMNDIPYGAENPYEHASQESITVGAEFVDTTNGTPDVNYFTVTLGSIVGNGTIMWSFDGNDWFGFPSEGYKVFSIIEGEPRSVYLRAAPGDDFEFSVWNGDVPYGAENPYEHVSEESITVGAEFVDTTNGTPDVDYFTVTLGSIVGNGTIMWSFDGKDWFDFPQRGFKIFGIVEGEPKTVYLKAVPGDDIEFSIWNGDVPHGAENPYEHVSEESITVGAEFVDTTNGIPDEDYFTVTIGDMNNGGTIMWSLEGTDWFDFPMEGYKIFGIVEGEPKTVYLKAVPCEVCKFLYWKNDIPSSGSNPYEYAAEKSISVGAEFELISGETDKHYYITATSDSGSTVSPEGRGTVMRGDSYTVSFSALNRCEIYSVLVDGNPVSLDIIDQGYYTFTNVMMNHSIQVLSTDKCITVEVKIVEGKGHVEYSTNGKTFNTYTFAIRVPANTYLSLMAYGDEGYKFMEWDTDAATYTSYVISFDDVTDSIYIEVHFASGPGGFDWALLLITALTILAVLALFFFLFYRKSYEVVEVAGATMNNMDKARRKKAHTFSLDGASGAVLYSIGDGPDKTLLPNPDGTYTIPKEDITGKVTIKRL